MRLVSLTWRRREEEKDWTLLLHPIVTDRTRPGVVEQLWELSGIDRTLPLLRPVVFKLTCPVATGTLLEVTGRWGCNTPVLCLHLGTANHAYHASSSIQIIHA